MLPRLPLTPVEDRWVAYVGQHEHQSAFVCCSAHACADDVPALVSRIRELEDLAARLEADNADANGRAADLEGHVADLAAWGARRSADDTLTPTEG